ncbi:MAG: UDP-glucose dehydrogenase family protein [Planctomycetota bacterium]|jgi:UDPglucose 6-dehydrogenase
MNITMVGTGYVGLVTGTCLANSGNHVVCLDVDQSKIDLLNHGGCPIYEPGLVDLIERNVKAGRLEFSTDKQASYQSAEVIFICVGTPSDEQGHADLSAVLAVAHDIGDAIEAGPGHTGGAEEERRAKIVVVKSTVPVGTNVRVREAIDSRTLKRFYMASNPEFLKEGDALNDFNKPDRVVLGVDTAGTGERLRDLYRPFVRQGNPIFVMDIPSAEMVKYASNAMLATKISFVNEIASLCESYGADIEEVRRGMCSDSRIGNQFLYPGLGYGGSCFPKDVLACIGMGLESHTPTDLLKAVHDVNQARRRHFATRIEAHYNGNLEGKHFGVWGLAFKPGTEDMREAPSVSIIEHLLERGATVTAYDPVAAGFAKTILGDRIAYADSAMDAIDGVDALILCTEWDEFRNPDFQSIKACMGAPVIFDGRNLYDPQHLAEDGFVHYSVGRAAPQTANASVDA